MSNQNNPLLTPSSLPHKAPAFDVIKEEHFLPAIEAAIDEARANINAIKNQIETADFDNTIVALEMASETLGTITSIFYNQLSANGTDELELLAEKIGPLKANFSSDVALDDPARRAQLLFDGIRIVTTVFERMRDILKARAHPTEIRGVALRGERHGKVNLV